MTSPDAPRPGRWRYTRDDGLEFDRVAFFTDAVFAIAMTLLIVSIGAPDLSRDVSEPSVSGDVSEPSVLWAALSPLVPEFISFFLAFLLLGRYWMTHHEFFASLTRVDRSLISTNLVYLAFVAFLPFPTELVGRYEENPVSVILFAVCLAAISGMESVLFAIAHRHDLMANKLGDKEYRVGMIQSMTPVVLFIVSIPIAYYWSPTVALFSWLLAIPLGIAVDRRFKVRSRDLMRPPAQEADGAP